MRCEPTSKKYFERGLDSKGLLFQPLYDKRWSQTKAAGQKVIQRLAEHAQWLDIEAGEITKVLGDNRACASTDCGSNYMALNQIGQIDPNGSADRIRSPPHLETYTA